MKSRSQRTAGDAMTYHPSRSMLRSRFGHSLFFSSIPQPHFPGVAEM